MFSLNKSPTKYSLDLLRSLESIIDTSLPTVLFDWGVFPAEITLY